MSSPVVSPIGDFYRGQNILITGATGFVGKCLLEKLLRTFAGQLGTVYLLIRPRTERDENTINPQSRVEKMLQKPPFSKLSDCDIREIVDYTGAAKIVAIAGDLLEPNLGISLEDEQELIQNVNIIIHSGASIKLNGPLANVINANFRATDKLLDLARKIPTGQLKVFLHLSTAYAYPEQEITEEKLYPPANPLFSDPDDFLEWFDSNVNEPNFDESKIVGNKMLTYLFSKSMTERLVAKRAQTFGIPAAIFRPSYVVGAAAEPAAGWIDTPMGITGILTMYQLGWCRTIRFNHSEKPLDIVPIDFVVNAIIAIGWWVGSGKQPLKLATELTNESEGEENFNQIFTLANSEWQCLPLYQFIKAEAVEAKNCPSLTLVRPMAQIFPLEKSKLRVKLERAVLEKFPAAILTSIANWQINNKSAKNQMQQKLSQTIDKYHAAQEIIENLSDGASYRIASARMQALVSKMSPADRLTFNFDIGRLDYKSFLTNNTLGVRRYILKESDSTIEQAIRRHEQLEFNYRIFIILTFFGFGLIFGKLLI